MFGSAFLGGHASMLGVGGGLNLSLTNQAYNLLHLAFREINVKALRAGLNSSLGHMWPLGLSLPTSVISKEVLTGIYLIRQHPIPAVAPVDEEGSDGEPDQEAVQR